MHLNSIIFTNHSSALTQYFKLGLLNFHFLDIPPPQLPQNPMLYLRFKKIRKIIETKHHSMRIHCSLGGRVHIAPLRLQHLKRRMGSLLPRCVVNSFLEPKLCAEQVIVNGIPIVLNVRSALAIYALLLFAACEFDQVGG